MNGMNFGGTIKLNPLGMCVTLGVTFIFFLYVFARRPSDRLINLKELLIAGVNVAENGGKEIKVYHNGELNKKSKGKTKEGAHEFVTDADIRSHCLMYYGLKLTFPGLKVVSEEVPPDGTCNNFYQMVSLSHSDEKLNSLENIFVPIQDVTVWIDPLDATQEFTENLNSYVTIMVCVAVKGIPIIGVIHQPFDHEGTSWAWDKTVSSDLHPPVEKFREHPVIVVSRSHAGKVKEQVSKVFPQASVIPAGGSGYKVLQLISGNASVYVHSTNIKKWDVCAGNAILNSVGGKMTTLKNEDIDYSNENDKVVKNGILAAVFNHDKFYEKLKNIA